MVLKVGLMWFYVLLIGILSFQALTPNMQSPAEYFSNNKTIVRLLGPALGDQKQGSFSVNLWKNAFQDASQRLCPVRAGGHNCGCLPELARMVCNPQVSVTLDFNLQPPKFLIAINSSVDHL